MLHMSKTVGECRHSGVICPMMESVIKPSPLQLQASLPAIIKSSQAKRQQAPSMTTGAMVLPALHTRVTSLALLAPDPLPAWATKARDKG